MKLRSATKFVIIHRDECEDWASKYNVHIDPRGVVSVSQELGIDGHGAHAKDFNGVSIGVTFHGDFCYGANAKLNRPTAAQLSVGADFIAELLYQYKLDTESVKGHSELGFRGTDVPSKLCYDPDGSCPGLNFDMSKFRWAVRCAQSTHAKGDKPVFTALKKP